MDDTPPDDRRAVHEQTVIAFVLRARRIASHSLARDPEALIRFAEMSGTVAPGSNVGEAIWTTKVPEEEILESAAARVRPLTLKKEQVNGERVTKALGFLVRGRDDADIRAALKALTARWRPYQSSNTEMRNYLVEAVQPSTGETVDQISDTVLGFAWLYGDVVHADAHRVDPVRLIGIKERYRAAVPLVCGIMRLALDTLGFIAHLRELGLLELPPTTWTEPVVFRGSVFIDTGAIHLSEAEIEGDEMPRIGDELGPEWEPL